MFKYQQVLPESHAGMMLAAGEFCAQPGIWPVFLMFLESGGQAAPGPDPMGDIMRVGGDLMTWADREISSASPAVIQEPGYPLAS